VHEHRRSVYPPPSADPAIRTILQVARRSWTPRRRPLPRPVQLARMAAQCPGDLAGLRDRALRLLTASGDRINPPGVLPQNETLLNLLVSPITVCRLQQRRPPPQALPWAPTGPAKPRAPSSPATYLLPTPIDIARATTSSTVPKRPSGIRWPSSSPVGGHPG
jgi:hypothetical protein